MYTLFGIRSTAKGWLRGIVNAVVNKDSSTKVPGRSNVQWTFMDNTITVVMEGNVGGRTSVARDF